MSDTAELEREAEAARARLSDTADQLRARMSPGQLMDEVLNQFREGDGNLMLSNLRTQARDNPMALALIGSGVAWLMFGTSGEPRLPAPSYPSRGLNVPSNPGLHENAPLVAAHPGSGSVKSAREDSLGPDSGGRVQEAVGDQVRAAREKAEGVVAGLQGVATDALAGASDLASQLGHQAHHGATELGGQARRTFLDVLEREPLVIGALGLAVGAAVGALIPASDLERQHLGSAGVALKEKAGSLVDRGAAMAQDTAAEVYETARNEADRQGLLPGERPIAEKVGEVVRAAGEKASDIAGESLRKSEKGSASEEVVGDVQRT
jgi:Protein of unknown function (DUF3618)